MRHTITGRVAVFLHRGVTNWLYLIAQPLWKWIFSTTVRCMAEWKYKVPGDYIILLLLFFLKIFYLPSSFPLYPCLPRQYLSVLGFLLLLEKWKFWKTLEKSFMFPGDYKEGIFFSFSCRKSNEIMNRIITIIMTTVKYWACEKGGPMSKIV